MAGGGEGGAIGEGDVGEVPVVGGVDGSGDAPGAGFAGDGVGGRDEVAGFDLFDRAAGAVGHEDLGAGWKAVRLVDQAGDGTTGGAVRLTSLVDT